MAEGEFSKALDHLARILQKNPEDKEAGQLEYTCREMIHIQNACEDGCEQENEISVREYASVHFRRNMKNLCHWMFCLLSKLPFEWQQKIRADRFRVWEIHFSVDSDTQKDWLWELLFWDTRRRRIVFSSLILVLLLCITLLLLLLFRGCDNSDSSEQRDFSTTVRSAYDGDSHAQFLLGKSFYSGKSLPRK